MLNKYKFVITALISIFAMTSVHADSTLVYELTEADGSKVEHTIAISGRWLRFESKPKGKADFVVMDTGRLLMFEIDNKNKNYQFTRMGVLYWPETALNSPLFKPLPKKKTVVTGVRCHSVNEIDTNESVLAEHCMSVGGPLGLNAREVITLSRLFMSTRRMGQSWLGVATSDERQISISSKDDTGRKLILKSVSHALINNNYFKIPADYTRLKPDLPIIKKVATKKTIKTKENVKQSK